MENATVALANSPIYKLFPAFLAKQLIGGQSFSSIKVFGAWFSRLRATGAQLPPLAVLIERVSKYDVTSSEALDTEGASLEDRAAFSSRSSIRISAPQGPTRCSRRRR